MYPDQYPDLLMHSNPAPTFPTCPSSDWVLASELLMTRTPPRTPSPTSQLCTSPIEHGPPQRHLSRMVSPTRSSSTLQPGCSVLAWTHTWSGSLEGAAYAFAICGEIVSSASGRMNTITGCSSTLSVSQQHEFGAMILTELEQSAALGSERVPYEEWKWIWEWAQ